MKPDLGDPCSEFHLRSVLYLFALQCARKFLAGLRTWGVAEWWAALQHGNVFTGRPLIFLAVTVGGSECTASISNLTLTQDRLPEVNGDKSRKRVWAYREHHFHNTAIVKLPQRPERNVR